jgi:hypothetical protein
MITITVTICASLTIERIASFVEVFAASSGEIRARLWNDFTVSPT